MSNDKSITESGDWMETYEGQLAIDVYQNDNNVIIKAPIAGVSREDLEISITDEVVTVKGERKHQGEARESYLCQECYWGPFSRSYVLPIEVMGEKAQASLKNGILTITIPKIEKTKTKTIEIKAEE
ncbi:MAG: Hsp20/alpha crystallin family protein [Patescibacteria group bacterium]|jgi:HSP20 family protein